MKCAVLNCSSNRFTPHLSFHRFPTDNQILNVWIAATGKHNFVPKENSKICSLHFVESDYIRPKWLKADAIPTKHLGSTDECNKIAIPSDSLSTILDKQTEIDKIQVNKTNITNVTSTALVSAPQLSQIVNFIPNGNFMFSSNSIQLNLMPLTVPVSLVQFQAMGGMSHATQPLTVKTVPAINSESNFLQDFPTTNQTPVHTVNSTISNKALTGNFENTKKTPVYTLKNSTISNKTLTGHFENTKKMPVHTVKNCTISNKPLTGHSENTKQTPMVPVKSTIKPITCRSENNLGAIKVVDVNKLLQPPLKRREESISINSSKLLEPKSLSPEVVKPAVSDESLKDSSDVKVSHVLKCLNVILPNNFDLSKLIPNEKVSRLIIRYLKLSDCVTIQDVVKSSLEVIVKASKSEIKAFGDFNKHPYMNIKPLALQVALTQLLPNRFSMIDVTDNLLNCLCIMLNQDVYTDGFPILRGKMFNFSSDNLEFEEIVNQDKWSNKDSLSNINKTISISNDSKNEVFIVENSCNSVLSGEDNNCTEELQITKEISPPIEKSNNSSGSQRHRKVTVKRKSYYVGTLDDDTKDPNYDPVSSNLQSKLSAKIKAGQFNIPRGMKDFEDDSLDFNYFFRSIIKYLDIKQCTAQDVLVSFKLLFHLCRYLNLRSKQSNLVKLKEILRLIVAKNINLSNVDHFERPYNQKHIPKSLESVDKLTMNPVVVLTDFRDYSLPLLYKGKKNQQLVKPKISSHRTINNNSFSQSSEKIDLTPKYSSEQVRKLTDESYTVFRKIIMKKANNKVVFRLKYKELFHGTKVFVKDCHRRSFGYVKGIITKRIGSISYLVELENGEKINCVVDRLRPVFDNRPSVFSTRTHRLIKPKQLFDL